MILVGWAAADSRFSLKSSVAPGATAVVVGAGAWLALFSLEDTMMTMSDAAMRTIVDIPEKQLDALAQLCAQQNISRAEAVRRAVDRLLKESSTPRKDAGFGIWKSKRIDSRKFVEKLRSEWSER
jgi:hypothetical protein